MTDFIVVHQLGFVYNAAGLRVKKIADGITTEYFLHGKLITHMTRGDYSMHFFYDGQSRPQQVEFTDNTKDDNKTSIYTYVHNLQGDIVGIVDADGNKVVEYTYDAWGKLLVCDCVKALMLGFMNPFRYRGYVYDEETGLYYLRSRYYNPVWGRFINADVLLGKIGSVISHNIFAYCKNSPIILVDPDGKQGFRDPMIENARWEDQLGRAQYEKEKAQADLIKRAQELVSAAKTAAQARLAEQWRQSRILPNGGELYMNIANDKGIKKITFLPNGATPTSSGSAGQWLGIGKNSTGLLSLQLGYAKSTSILADILKGPAGLLYAKASTALERNSLNNSQIKDITSNGTGVRIIEYDFDASKTIEPWNGPEVELPDGVSFDDFNFNPYY